jgi:hypothetical protein
VNAAARRHARTISGRVSPAGVVGLALALALATAAPLARAQVYKCQDASGRTTYTDAPCARGARPLAIPDGAPALARGSSVCAQLDDELNRLAAAEAGRKSPSSRRVTLQRQYEARCIGISRSPPTKP